MSGYLTVIGGEITSASIFIEAQHHLILSLADILDKHNYTELTRLAELLDRSGQHPLPVRYEARGRNPFGISVGTLDIPISPATPDRKLKPPAHGIIETNIMHWNYRVVIKNGSEGIHEVYYDDHGSPSSLSEESVVPVASDIEELREVLDRLRQATKDPVLAYDDIAGDAP